MKFLSMLVLGFVLGLSGCSWVKLTDQGQQVKVAEISQVQGCRDIGTTTVSLLAKVAGVDRNADKVQRELNTLARNSAAKMGGNTVVAISEVTHGEQVFEIYSCN